MLVQESQQFKHNFLLLFMKLKWFLKRWRQGKVLPSEGDDFLEVWSPWHGDWGWGRCGGDRSRGTPSWYQHNPEAHILRSHQLAGFHPCIHSLIQHLFVRTSPLLGAVAGAEDTQVKKTDLVSASPGESLVGDGRSLTPL